MKIRIVCSVAICLFFASCLLAQTKAAPPSESKPAPLAPQAKRGDVDSMDHILAALYDVISGPLGQKRDWDRFRSLFLPGARLIPSGPRPQGGFGARVLTADEYVERAQPFLEKEGFFENEIARHTDQYGQIAQVFSTYESRHAQGEKPFARGINSIQLMSDGTRWWVVTIFWEGERPDNPIPAQYLK